MPAPVSLPEPRCALEGLTTSLNSPCLCCAQLQELLRPPAVLHTVPARNSITPVAAYLNNALLQPMVTLCPLSCACAHPACQAATAAPSPQQAAHKQAFCLQAGLKTGMYYLRTRAAADAIKFTVDQQALAKNKAARTAKLAAASEVGKELKVRAEEVLLMLVTTVACYNCAFQVHFQMVAPACLMLPISLDNGGR